MKKRSASMALAAFMPLVYLILAAAVAAALSTNGTYPSGQQAMFHIYRGNVVLRSLRQGILYPRYDPLWFNGTELFRAAPPLTAYALALCQALAGGSVFYGYLLFVGLSFYIGAMAWLGIGVKMERPVLGAVLGIVWFFLPYNLYVLLVEGDLARALAAVLLPWLFDQVWCFLQSRRWTAVPRAAICVCLLTLTHAAYAAMAALCIVVLALVHGLLTRRPRGLGNLLLAVFAGAAAAGLWLAPYMASGILSLDHSYAMETSFQPLAQSLDPVSYFETRDGAPYFGLALFITACLTGVFGRRKAVPGAWTAVVLVLLTSTASYVVIHILPGSQYLRMLWVFPAAAAIAFLAFLSWGTLRRPLPLILCLLLVVDAFPALTLVTGSGQVRTPADERMNAVMSAALLDEAQAITTHRLAILDEGELGSAGSFLAAGWGTPVPIIGGDDRTHAATMTRLTRISRALTGGQYLYVFDRCLELGCDTVLLQGGVVKWEDLESGAVDEAARRLGYTLAASNGGCYLYHADLGSGWGLVSRYSAIGIGATAYYMSLFYPCVEEASDTNLNHYTFEQLSQYDLVFLSGFTYDQRDEAEELVLSLSEAGVHIVIEADGIPESRQTRDRKFLGVSCQDIEFSNGYPELDTIDGRLNTDLFPQGYTKWETVYTEGLDEVWGSIVDNGITLPFYGTVCNEDIVVVGLNLSLHYELTKDPSVGTLLGHAMALPEDRLPDRAVVPLEIEYTAQGMTFTAAADEVNTTIAWHDSFRSQEPVKNDGQLLQVGQGTTTILLVYPYFAQGLIISLLGIAVLAAVTWNSRRMERIEQVKEKPAEGEDGGASGEEQPGGEGDPSRLEDPQACVPP